MARHLGIPGRYRAPVPLYRDPYDTCGDVFARRGVAEADGVVAKNGAGWR